MNIIFANQKGGSGKTTHCNLFANYLVLQKKQELLVLDMDFQSSIKSQWDADRQNYDNPSLYEVIDIDLSESASLMEQLTHVEGHILIDLPGRVDDDHLVPVFQKAHLAICPFAYDQKTFESTLVTAQVIRHINSKIPIVFIPNRLKTGAKYRLTEQVNEMLAQFGTITPALPDKVAFQRIDTLTIPEDIGQELTQTYDFIYDRFLAPQKVK